MKRKLWLIAAAAMICTVMFAVGVGAITVLETSFGNYHCQIMDGKATITGVKGEISGNITIPSMLGEYPVTGIGGSVFNYCEALTSLTIPNSVSSIGRYAFSNCTNLTSISIPDSVSSIGDYAFLNCSNLTSITLPNSLTSIGDWVFDSCTSLTSITIPDSVTSIGSLAFRNCTSLTSITLPNSVSSIGSSAFYNCSSLTSITIPNSVTFIAEEAFSPCSSLTAITVSSSNASYTDVDGVLFNKDKTMLLAYPNGKPEKEYTIPNSVTSIGGHAFEDCSNLTSITIPNGVTSIGACAFSDCANLTSILIPNSVTSIGVLAFWNCYDLTSITIPDSVTSIGDSAFDSCRNVTIYGYSNTTAETYAKNHNIPFIDITVADEPVISTDITSASYIAGDSVTLSVTASVTDGGTLSYQWFVSDTESGTGTAIPGATAETYTFTTADVGIKYYYVTVTNTNSFGMTAAAKSSVAAITIRIPLYTIRGSIISSGDGNVIISLLKDGVSVDGVTVTVTADSYEITNVPAGTYTMRVSKKNHVTREYPLAVGKP